MNGFSEFIIKNSQRKHGQVLCYLKLSKQRTPIVVPALIVAGTVLIRVKVPLAPCPTPEMFVLAHQTHMYSALDGIVSAYTPGEIQLDDSTKS